MSRRSGEGARIGVKMTDLYDGSHPVVDWLGKPRYLSIAIASG